MKPNHGIYLLMFALWFTWVPETKQAEYFVSGALFGVLVAVLEIIAFRVGRKVGHEEGHKCVMEAADKFISNTARFVRDVVEALDMGKENLSLTDVINRIKELKNAESD